MNLFKKEIKTGLKPFLFWTLGLFMFVFAGIVKSSAAMADGQFMTQLIHQFPPIVVAAMGMANVDITQFEGFYAVLTQAGYTVDFASAQGGVVPVDPASANAV